MNFFIILASFPETWTRDNVTDWLTWCSNEYGLHKVPFNKFEMNGNYKNISKFKNFIRLDPFFLLKK